MWNRQQNVWLLFAVTAIPLVSAFGFVGHYIIGEVVKQTVAPEVRLMIEDCNLLAPFNGSMGRASVWADTAKYTKQYSWTRSLHYFDGPNDPPLTCSRIGDNVFTDSTPNLMTALKNLTFDMSADTCKCPSQLQFNLLTHFLQDLHQPLHLTGKARGGNQIHFELKNKRYSLHGFWDSTVLDMFMRETLPQGERHVKGAIKYFVAEARKTTLDNDGDGVVTSSHRPSILNLLLNWANDISSENCMLLWQYDNMTDDEYIQRSMHLVKQLIVKSILRTVVTFNQIFKCSKEERLVMQAS